MLARTSAISLLLCLRYSSSRLSSVISANRPTAATALFSLGRRTTDRRTNIREPTRRFRTNSALADFPVFNAVYTGSSFVEQAFPLTEDTHKI